MAMLYPAPNVYPGTTIFPGDSIFAQSWTQYPGSALYPGFDVFPGDQTIPVEPPVSVVNRKPLTLRDLTVEVRDKSLARIGQIRPEDLVDFKISDSFNNVGVWTLKLPPEHHLADDLKTPGAGIIVTGPDDVLFSGPVTNPVLESSPDDPMGTITFEGVSDGIILQDYLSIPEPTNPDLTTQSLAHDTRTGTVEDLLHAYVNANIGPAAPSSRRKANLVMGTNLHRGPVITKSPRFPVLGALLTEIALLGAMNFRVVQRGPDLVFETREVVNRTDIVRLDVENGQLIGQKITVTAPTATRVLVAGQEQGVKRQFILRDSPLSLAAEEEWGRRIERFLDQRQTDVVAELEQAGDEILLEEGFTSMAAQVVPAENTSMLFGVDWYLGDRVAVVVDGQELQGTVTGAVIAASSDGLRVGALIGDPTQFNADASMAQRVQTVEDRVSNLEANAEATPSVAEVEAAVDSKAEVGHTHAIDDVVDLPEQLEAKWTRWVGTLATYNAIATKDPNTLYVVI